MDTFSSVDYDQRSQMHHHHDYGVETSDTALFDNIINSYEKSDHELDGKLLTVYRIYLVDLMEGFFRRQKNIFSWPYNSCNFEFFLKPRHVQLLLVTASS